MATREITVTTGGTDVVTVVYSDDSKVIPTKGGRKAVSALIVGDIPNIYNDVFAEIVSIP